MGGGECQVRSPNCQGKPRSVVPCWSYCPGLVTPQAIRMPQFTATLLLRSGVLDLTVPMSQQVRLKTLY
ncbi:hypothetical protein E2C01_055555 [Portunus trituberculatus]|uniref:Uncharacterized protein n=1 Tax=Portunus trituberculatus TaxID=210409 RepID=A0A5B7GV36_PORTR|nr:hypothetical protein [Portunus trituberculatus]